MTEKMIKKKVVLEAYVQTSYDTFSHIFRMVEIEIPDDGNNWHSAAEITSTRIWNKAITKSIKIVEKGGIE